MIDEKKKEEIAKQLVADDEEITIDEATVLWEKYKRGLERPEYRNGGHFGDCTLEPQTCLRCLVEKYLKRADSLTSLIVADDQTLPTVDEKVQKRWRDATPSSEWMHYGIKLMGAKIIKDGWVKVRKR